MQTFNDRFFVDLQKVKQNIYIMLLEISDTIIEKSGMTNSELLLRLAILLFEEEKLTLVQASQLAGLHQIQFQKELAKRKIPVHYGKEELLADMETISKMKF